jgi:catechol 2,3-dioxygenase-like lactoylglutathione lyase family enzyme
MDWKLELIVVPVTDVDRAKRFYLEQAGFELIVDVQPNETFRVVQLVPPGSACAIAIGTMAQTEAPLKGLHLIVEDIEAARAELVERGTEVSELYHFDGGGQTPGPDPQRSDYNTFFDFSDPDGNLWLVQEVSARSAGDSTA